MRLFLFVLLSLFIGQAAAQPVEHFARLPKLQDVNLAPDGSGFTAEMEVENRYEAAIFKSVNGEMKLTYRGREDDTYWVRMIDWANPDRVLISIGFTAKRNGVDTVESRLFGVDATGGELEPLFPTVQDTRYIQFQDDIVSWLPKDPDHVILRIYNPIHLDSIGLYRVSVKGSPRYVAMTLPSNSYVYYWLLDSDGIIRAGSGDKNDIHHTPYIGALMPNSSDWIDLSEFAGDDKPDFNILGFSAEPNIFYVESGHEYDPPAVYKFDILKKKFVEMIFHHPTVEAAGLRLDPFTYELRGITYFEDQEKTIWVDEGLKTEINDISNIFKQASVSLYDESYDKNFAVYFVSSPTWPGQYFIYDRKQKHLAGLPEQYPELANVELSKIVATNYQARDGLSIPAYVTLPKGVKNLADLKNKPFVINPHGGPAARDFLSFDYWTQFLASRGYAVLQMNFRGSEGYGEEFRESGHKEWGQAMQDDITDGVKWLIAQGYADADRVAILGGSYGGYAALMGGAKTPELYQCIISFAGVSDLPGLIRQESHYLGGYHGTRFIGNLWEDGAMLRENSPVNRAKDFTAPVLLIHGEDDRVVDIEQSRRMNRALENAGKDVTYIEFEHGDHYLSLYANRLRFLQEVEKFLSGCL